MKSYTCTVEGSFAGSKFQSWVRDAADQLGLKGWVRNIGHNKAEVLLQGSAESYGVFRERMKAEAPVPDLSHISCKSLDYHKEFHGFETRG